MAKYDDYQRFRGDLYKGGMGKTVSGGTIPHGYGHYIWRNKQNYGDEYKGELYLGEFHGEGTYKWANGSWFEGIWSRGEKVRGTMYNSDGSVRWSK
jgi:hypothetical protein